MRKQEIILKSIKDVVKNTEPRCEIYLYGSKARGDSGKDSDWDILILLNIPKVNFELEKMFIDALYDIEIETGEVISPLIYSKTEWDQNHSFTPLYENIAREGIRL